MWFWIWKDHGQLKPRCRQWILPRLFESVRSWRRCPACWAYVGSKVCWKMLEGGAWKVWSTVHSLRSTYASHLIHITQRHIHLMHWYCTLLHIHTSHVYTFLHLRLSLSHISSFHTTASHLPCYMFPVYIPQIIFLQRCDAHNAGHMFLGHLFLLIFFSLSRLQQSSFV